MAMETVDEPAALPSAGDNSILPESHLYSPADQTTTKLAEQLESAIRNDRPNQVQTILASAKHASHLLETQLRFRSTNDDQIKMYDTTALALAATLNRTSIAKLILEQHTKTNTAISRTALHSATRYGSRDIMDMLLLKGADVNQLDQNGLSPLHLACHKKDFDTAGFLLKRGANVNQPKPNGDTPLFQACAEGDDRMIDMLVGNYEADIHWRNNSNSTPILHACHHTQLDSLRTLLKHRASVLDVDNDSDNCFHKVLYNQKPLDDLEILRTLARAGANVDHINKTGYSPLRVACERQNYEQVECLVTNLGANVNQKESPTEETSLMTACRYPDTEIVNKLLQWGANMGLTNIHLETALKLACSSNQLENVKFLIGNGVDVTVCDKGGHTPLYTAAVNGHIEVALEILATAAYFPRHLAKRKAFTERLTSVGDVTRIENELMKHVDKDKYNKQEQLQPIFHWAISSGASKLAKHCISCHGQVPKLERSGAAWLHVAIAGGSVKTARLLLEKMDDQLKKTQAILEQNSLGDSPLTISIKQKNKPQQEIFWKEVCQLGTTHDNLMNSDPALGNKILEALAKYEIPGHEDVLKKLLQKWFGGGGIEGMQNPTTLHWAVHRCQPVIVWWLLSKGGYSSGYVIENALRLIPGTHEAIDVQHYIRELLLDPPPILDQVANPNDHIATKPELMDIENPALSLEGTIIDICIDGDIVSIPYAKAKVDDIIYKLGPESLMRNTKESLEESWKEHDLDELKRKLKQNQGDRNSSLTQDSSKTPNTASSPTATLRSSLNGTDDAKRSTYSTVDALKLRWIHLPVNELHLMRDLAYRLSHESKRSEMDHMILMKHFNQSWTELAAGGKQNFMKPRCVRQTNSAQNQQKQNSTRDHKKQHSTKGHRKDRLTQSQPPEKLVNCTSLYMPYLTVGNYTREKHGFQPGDTGESLGSRKSRRLKHNPITLDQYYYPSIADTDERDNDQVLSKFLESRTHLKPGNCKGGKKILLVNQLWLWIIDERTMITATTEDPNQEFNARLFESTLNCILYGDTRSRFKHVGPAQSVMELILGVTTESFTKKTVSCLLPNREGSAEEVKIDQVNEKCEKKGVVEIFREYVRTVANDETKLFWEFLSGLKNEAEKSKDSRRNVKVEESAHQQNRYHIISKETDLLHTTRDIRDELHILKCLAEHQNTVWKQALPPGPSGSKDRFQYYHSSTPGDIMKDLDGILSEAEQATNYITTLLNLREAEYSRIQAKDSAKQSKSILVFTIITIVFLPLSFLSSLFALNVSIFPHEPKAGGGLAYEAWWIFPILFGVTAAVSIPAIIVAWNVNNISHWLRIPGWLHIKKWPRWRGKEHMTKELGAEDITKYFMKQQNMLRNWSEPVRRRHDGDTLPQFNSPPGSVRSDNYKE